MSGVQIERSEEQAEPIELYKIKLGSKMYYLTDSSDEIMLQSTRYKPVHIKRDEIVHDLKLFDERLKISIPVRSDIAREMLNFASEEESNLTIIRAFKGNHESYTLWHGVIIQKNIDKEYLSLISFPTNYLFEKVGNRGRYSRTCRHVLYSKPCGLIKVNNMIISSVSTHTNQVITVATTPDKNLISGIVEFPRLGTSRMIIGVEDNKLILLSPIFNVQNGDEVRLYKGCNKTLQQCQDYGNADNFGGYPFIPVKNIFTGGVG